MLLAIRFYITIPTGLEPVPLDTGGGVQIIKPKSLDLLSVASRFVMVWLSIAYRHFSFKAINNLSNLSKCVRLGYAHRDSRERQNNRPVRDIMFYPIYDPSMMAMDIPV